MSKIKVNSLEGVGASTPAITIDNASGTCTANLSNRQGKNLVINGGFRIAQRSQSSTVNGYTTVDRFNIYHANTGVTCTNSQQALTSSDTPYTLGFRDFYRMALSGAGTANANAEIALYYNFEAQDIACSGWNFKSASSFVTLQFWVRCSTNQTFYCYLQSKDGTEQSYAFSFTASGNNAWTKITKTIPGGSNVDINSDNGTGLTLSIVPFFGTDLTGNKTLDQWSAFSASNRHSDMASTWLTAGASTFDLTGIQLEVGSVATDFEFLSFADELRRCQRYFYMHVSGAESASTTAQAPIGLGYGYTSSDCYLVVKYPVTMRVYPSMYKVVGTDYFAFFYNNNSSFPDNVANNRVATNSAEIYFYSGASWDQNAGGMVRVANSAARIGFDAEL